MHAKHNLFILTLSNMNKQEQTIHREISEVYIDYYNEEEHRWYVDCYWIVPNENVDKKYEVDEEWERRRGTTMAYIDNNNVEYNPIFETFAKNNQIIQQAITDFIQNDIN